MTGDWKKISEPPDKDCMIIVYYTVPASKTGNLHHVADVLHYGSDFSDFDELQNEFFGGDGVLLRAWQEINLPSIGE